MASTKYKFLAVFLTLYFTHGVLAEDLPSFIHVCHRSDPNLEKCLLASVEDIRPYLIEVGILEQVAKNPIKEEKEGKNLQKNNIVGVLEYNIPSLEPLIMKDFFSEETVGMQIVVSNVSAWGCSDFFVRGIEIDLENHHTRLDVDIPKLRIEAHYTVDGKLLLVPVKGSGNLDGNITEVSAIAQLEGELFDKDGHEHMRYTQIMLKVHVGGGSIKLENLFNGDKVLLTMINDVVNKNLDVFLKELMPIIEKALSSVFLETANAIVSPYTFEQLFPN